MSTGRRPIRILHVTFNMGFGGTEQVIRQLVSGMPTEFFENRILCIDGYVGEIGHKLQDEGVTVSHLSRRDGFDPKLIRQLRQKILEWGIDVVHCHQYTPWVYGWAASRLTGARVVFTEHGRFHPDRFRRKAFLLNPLMALMTDSVVAISEATRHALGRYEFIPKRKIRVIYNGIAGLESDQKGLAYVRRELGVPPGDALLGTVARLDPVKNQSMMLEAFARVLTKKPSVWLLMVGDGPARPELEQRAHDLGVDHRVLFTGFCPEPGNYLAAMDVFLLSSHTEGTSMTLLEAMSLGIPTVATNVGGNPEIVSEGETGYLTPTNDAVAFSEAILSMLDDPELMQAFSQRARNRFHESFALSKMIQQYAVEYGSIAATLMEEARGTTRL